MRKILSMQRLAWVLSLVILAGGCQSNGGPLIDGDIGTVVDDNSALSVKVKNALRASPQTSNVNIRVTTVSGDSVKLSGFVSNDAVLYEAERVANKVPGVRFVVNSLVIR